ncbi:hypothetical protein E4U43_005165 [Claviceps pusilla]|uniref:Sensitive to high expression protein 9, mitochondrial n=1 Tax=Claviceps pusilla TaxID=123648 RepID=A0A9P7N3A3_9HYPO|nr:hypothetical protein E4U43_005165 [Claviceps pusilla]
MQPLGAPMARVAMAGSRRMLQSPLLASKSNSACRLLSSILNRPNRPPSTYTTRLFSFSSSSSSSSSSSQNPSRGTASRPSSTSNAQEEATPAETRSRDEPRPSLAIELPSETDRRRSNLNQRFSHVMDNVQARVLTASQTLNDITGYSAIEAIKNENGLLEVQLAEAHATVRAARQAYKSSNTKRATTQREVTTLLARKDTWSPSDLERFTELYRTDHELEGEVAKAQEALTESEIEEQSLSQRLNAGILKRYHEEQIWSDRIRRASTWGTWGLMGMNFLLFVVLQFFAEPWRRRRLVKGVVEEEKRVLEQVRGELEAVKTSLTRWQEESSQAAQEMLLSQAAETPTPNLEVAVSNAPQEPWTHIIMKPARWKAAAADLCSERIISLRMKDASTLALQGAVAGAAIAGSLVMIFKS